VGAGGCWGLWEAAVFAAHSRSTRQCERASGGVITWRSKAPTDLPTREPSTSMAALPLLLLSSSNGM
jgi:hypothetical protein